MTTETIPSEPFITAIGAAQCCNQTPRIGRHPYHIYRGKVEAGMHYGVYCPICHASKSVWDGGPLFALHHWNEEHGEDCKTGAPEGYRWGSLRVTFQWMGGKREHEFHIVLFKGTDLKLSEGLVHPCSSISLIHPITGREAGLTFRKGRRGYVWLNKASVFGDGTVKHYYGLNVEVYPSSQGHVTDTLKAIGYEIENSED